MNYYRNLRGNPILRLYLLDNIDIDLYTEEDIIYISNSQSSTYEMSLDGYTFTKADIKAITFLPDWNLNFIPNHFCHSYINLLEINSFPDTIETIGNNCFYGSGPKHNAIIFPKNLISIGVNFLRSSEYFVNSLDFSKSTKLESIGHQFINKMSKFNKPINFPSSLKTIGAECFYNLPEFNSDIYFPSGLAISNMSTWFYNLPKFNKNIDLSNTIITKINNSIYKLPEFNSEILLPEDCIQTIQMLTVYDLPKFTKSIKIYPASNCSIESFCIHLFSFNGPFYYNKNFVDGLSYNSALFCSNDSDNIITLYKKGIKCIPASDITFEALHEKLPDVNTTNGTFRKLIK